MMDPVIVIVTFVEQSLTLPTAFTLDHYRLSRLGLMVLILRKWTVPLLAPTLG
jgi:hypothetical protein